MGAIRRSIYRGFLLRSAPYIVAFPIAIAVTIPLWVASRWLGAGVLSTVSVLGAARALTIWLRYRGEAVASSVPGLISDPGYDGHLGFLHLVDEDMKRILELVATPEKPLVVFVDDLDRCSYTTVSQVIEALNAFLNGDFSNCIFVIAMEPDLLASQIHVAYEKLFERMSASSGEDQDLGWRFLEKMVQLPLALPPLDESRAETLVDAIIGTTSEEGFHEAPDEAVQVEQLRAEMREVGTLSVSGIRDGMNAVRQRRVLTEPMTAAFEEQLQRAARLEFTDQFNDRSSREMVLAFAREFLVSPREIKRFMNVFRFYAYIDFWRHTEGLSAPGVQGVAKLARLTVGWPHLLTALGSSIEVGSERGTVLHFLEECGSDREAWDERIAHVPPTLRPEMLSSERLRAAIVREPAVGDSAAGFL